MIQCRSRQWIVSAGFLHCTENRRDLNEIKNANKARQATPLSGFVAFRALICYRFPEVEPPPRIAGIACSITLAPKYAIDGVRHWGILSW